jgi:hypothetical protein
MAKIPKKALLRITSGIKKFQSIINSAKAKDITESDTSAIIMDMLAEIFGYEKYSEITSEYKIKNTYCDLAIKLDKKIRFLIETKAIGLELKHEHIKQAVDYGSNEGADWVILTNGNIWKVFKIVFDKPVSNDLIYEFEILKLNPKKQSDIELLYYISKESVGRCALEDFIVERQTLSKYFIGQILLTEPVLGSIRKTIKKVCPDVKVINEDIKNVLIQELVRRDVFEDERSIGAKRKINKVIKSSSK